MATEKTTKARPSTESRLRFVGMHVQLELVLDDGETLRPVKTPPINLDIEGWEQFNLESVVAQFQAELERQGTIQSNGH
jgi:hypothetical protein